MHAHSAKLNHWFMRECLAEQLLPKFLQHLSTSNASSHPFPGHWQSVISDHIAFNKRVKEEKFRQAHLAWLNLTQVIPPSTLLSCKTLASRTLDHYVKTRSAKLRCKLQRLITQSSWNTASLHDCVQNNSSHVLTSDEHTLLGLGLAFSLPPKPETYTDLITSIQHLESYARNLVPELRTLKGCVLTALHQLNNKGAGLPRRLNKALQSLKGNAQLMILRADKGNMVVVMDKDKYLSAAEEMLSDTNVYARLRRNPMETEQAKYNNEVNRIFESMPIGAAPPRYLAYLPTLPHLYVTPKIHKDPIKYRPIVSQARAFTTPLARKLT